MHPIAEEHRSHGGGTLTCTATRPSGSQAVCVAWSWFRQNSIVSSHPPALIRVLRDTPEGAYPLQGATQTPAVGRSNESKG